MVADSIVQVLTVLSVSGPSAAKPKWKVDRILSSQFKLKLNTHLPFTDWPLLQTTADFLAVDYRTEESSFMTSKRKFLIVHA